MIKQRFNPSKPLLQALLVVALLWTQIAGANHLHVLDFDSSGDELVAECLTCQQLSSSDCHHNSPARVFAVQAAPLRVNSPIPTLEGAESLRFAIRAPPQP